MPYLYIDRWEWVSRDTDYWTAPQSTECLGRLDLRGPVAAGQKATVDGWGLFVYGEPQSLSIPLGELDGYLTKQQRNALNRNIECPDAIPDMTIRDILWWLLTNQADITGNSRWKPIMPTVNGEMELLLGGFSKIKSERYVHSKHPLVADLVKHDYAICREESIARGSEHHRRVLDALAKKYKVHWSEISSKESPLPHQTTITESFNTADSDTLGPDLTWVESEGDTDIVSNRANNIAGPNSWNTCYTTDALSSDDHYAQIDLVAFTGASDYCGVTARHSTVAKTFYWGRYEEAAVRPSLKKLVNGVETALDTGVYIFSGGETFKIECNGSTIKFYIDGAEKCSVTDTAITGNLNTGFASYRNGSFDNFEAADLAAGGLSIPIVMHHRKQLANQ